MPAAPDPTTMPRLRADCSRCAGLCCVAPAFSASSDFAITKPAGTPCPNLGADFGCTIHAQLRPRGFPGCTVFDCFGAGQKVVQETFDGANWRDTPAIASQMFASFHVMRDLHELLWYLTEALTLAPARPIHDELRAALDETTRLTELPSAELVEVDVRPQRERVGALLLRASELVRARRRGPDRRGADLVGRNLRRADLRGANLRGAYLIGSDLRGADLRVADMIGADLLGSDLRGADLRVADMIGADLRGARLGGADLRGTIFLTQSQLDAARGDPATRLPASLARPGHWR